MKPFFIFNNISSLDVEGIIVNKLPKITRAEVRVESVIVPGKNGKLYIPDNTYESDVKTIEFSHDGNDIDFIKTWLKGSGKVTFSNQPDRYYNAYIVNKIPFEQVIPTFHKGIVIFECEPFGYSQTENKVTITARNYTLNYTGTAEVKPLVKITGTGNITLTINNANIILTGVDGYITLDGDLQDAYKDTTLQNNKMQGEFPVFKPGANTIDFLGNVTKIEITYREAYL